MKFDDLNTPVTPPAHSHGDGDVHGDTGSSDIDIDFRQDEEEEDGDDDETKAIQISIKRQRFPFCLVWTTIPGLSALLPFIGHAGICYSNGVIRDFGGPYYVGNDDFAFGKVRKYVQLDASGVDAADWDKAIHIGSRDYTKMFHTICFNNCHHHVAHCLNLMKYRGKQWNQFNVWWKLTTESKYVSNTAVVLTYLPFCLLLFIIVLFALVF